MVKKRIWLEGLVRGTDFSIEPLPGKPIVEIAGDRRVLIENHLGVKAYGQEKITVNVAYGAISICGYGLEILRMTREQLVIRGKIDGVMLQRRG